MPHIQMEAQIRSPRIYRDTEQAEPRQSRWKANTERLQREALLIWFVLKNRGTPWYARGICACVAAYIFSPVQLIPSFIPVIGFLDDFLVLSAGLWLIRILTPERIVQEARRMAEIAMRRGENIRMGTVRTATIVVAVVWLAATITCFFVMYRRI
jgi:uncharacterized membrane protein YkvA (DUF1232 family)